MLAVHGLNDWNVKTPHVGQWWDALAARGVPRKIWLHQGGHTDPFNVRRAEWLDTLHRWFDHWLYDLDNGVMAEPMADVETAPGTWVTSRSWPVPGTRSQAFFLGAGAAGSRGRSRGRRSRGRRQSFVDDAVADGGGARRRRDHGRPEPARVPHAAAGRAASASPGRRG